MIRKSQSILEYIFTSIVFITVGICTYIGVNSFGVYTLQGSQNNYLSGDTAIGSILTDDLPEGTVDQFQWPTPMENPDFGQAGQDSDEPVQSDENLLAQAQAEDPQALEEVLDSDQATAQALEGTDDYSQDTWNQAKTFSQEAEIIKDSDFSNPVGSENILPDEEGYRDPYQENAYIYDEVVYSGPSADELYNQTMAGANSADRINVVIRGQTVYSGPSAEGAANSIAGNNIADQITTEIRPGSEPAGVE